MNFNSSVYLTSSSTKTVKDYSSQYKYPWFENAQGLVFVFRTGDGMAELFGSKYDMEIQIQMALLL